MNKPVRSLTLSLAGLALLALASSALADPALSWSEVAVMAAQALQNGDYAAAARDYEVAAQRAPAIQQPDLLLSAAAAALKVNDAPRAAALLGRIPTDTLDAAQSQRLLQVRAALAQARQGVLQGAGQVMVQPAAPSAAAPQPVTTAGAVALLLPLSGPLASVAAAIRDGFMTAYLRSHSQTPVRVYDAGSTPDAAGAAYQHALRDGARMIVGPLRKDAVAAIAAQPQLLVPVLALNNLDSSAPAPAHFYQYGLAPEDEARAAAERAVADGARRAVALVPQSDWGDRVLRAFTQQLTQLGGSVLKSARYSSGQTDFSKPIQEIFNLEASKARHRALTSVLGMRTEFEPRRRDDVDFVFLAARPGDARQILPQLRFFRASGLPIYATSLIYDGTADNDVNGVIFCDMPWILQTDGDYAAQRVDTAELSSAKAQPRLFAFGMDAWSLISRIQSGAGSAGMVYPSATGGLLIGANGVVTRKLNCARIAGGVPRLLDISMPGLAAPAAGQ
ncbi:MAG: penicillin-binding protein activator [Stenotrophobium sp.]